MPPDPEVPGAVNLRDVGGLPAGAAVTRHGVLFRSGNLAQLDASGTSALGGLGLRRIIDLRADEVEEHETRIIRWVRQRVEPIAGPNSVA